MAEKVLVVDDDESMLEICAAAFQLDGHDVSIAEGGGAALKKLEAGAFDAVVCDLFMPGMDGTAVLKEIKTRSPDTAVVMITATPSLRTAIETLRVGAYDYVIKPFETEHLRAVVRRALEHRRLRSELQAERALRQELATAYTELQKVERLKEAFLARIGHELRTPLSEMLAASHLMRSSGGDDGKLKRYVELSTAAAERLDQTLSDLLSYVEVQGSPDLGRRETVDLAALSAQALEKAKPLWEPRRITAESRFAPDTPPIQGDPELLSRAFEHLVRNAALFNRDGGRIFVTGRVQADSVLVTVTDTGEGIPESEFDRVFDSFYQIADYLTRKVGGLGLGLAITRRIVEAHGGRIDVSSRLGEGTTFRVQLPVHARAPREPETVRKPAGP